MKFSGVISTTISSNISAEILNIVNNSFGHNDARHQLPTLSNKDFEYVYSEYNLVFEYLRSTLNIIVGKKSFPLVINGGQYVCYIDKFVQSAGDDKLIHIKVVK